MKNVTEELADARVECAALTEVIRGELTDALKAEGNEFPSADDLAATIAGAIALRVVIDPSFKKVAIRMLAVCLVDKALEVKA